MRPGIPLTHWLLITLALTGCSDEGTPDASTHDANQEGDGSPMDAATEDAGRTDGGPESLNPTLTGVAAGTALDLGVYECAEETGHSGCASITDYSGYVYDSDRHQMLMFGGGHSSTGRTDVAVFPLDTLAWESAYPSTPCAAMDESNYHSSGEWADTGHPLSIHTYDSMVYFPSTQALALLSNYREGRRATTVNECTTTGLEPGPDTRSHIYSVAERSWTASSQGPLAQAAEFDPISGRALVARQSSLALYDADTDTSQALAGGSLPGWQGDGGLTYVPSLDRFYYISTYDWRASACPTVTPPFVIEITLDRASGSFEATNLADAMGGDQPNFGCAGQSERGFALDPLHGELITLRRGDVYAFDPATYQWRRSPVESISPDGTIVDQVYFAIEHDPVNGVFIVMGGPYNDRRTWAYRHHR